MVRFMPTILKVIMTEPLKKLHITKGEINELPMRRYEGPIHLIRTKKDAEDAAKKLSGERLLGFDTETRPAFRSGESYLPSLLQLGTDKEVFLFQLQHCGLTPGLIQIFENPDIIKSGVSIRQDVSELRALADFVPVGFFELADVAKKEKIKNLGLRGLAALLMDFRISKREQVSNWSRDQLTDSQITYAATDAWLGHQIYQRFVDLGFIAPPAKKNLTDRITAWFKGLFGRPV